MNNVQQLGPPPLALLEGASLFLDFDGTMVSLAATPDAVKVPLETRQLLTDLDNKLEGRLAIVSGRDVATLRGSFGLTDFAIAGSHGAEISLNGEPVSSPIRATGLDGAFQKLQEFAAPYDGIVVEDKPLGVGLHYRLAPDKVGICRTIADDLVSEFGLVLQHGKMMFELRGDKADKGVGIKNLMQQVLFMGGTPVFIGDDVTDENGFQAVKALGGAGIKVGNAGETHASYALPDANAVHEYLERFADNEVD